MGLQVLQAAPHPVDHGFGLLGVEVFVAAFAHAVNLQLMVLRRLDAVAAFAKLQQTLTDVRRAEVKLAEGSYNLCDVCAEPIAAARLEALPWATRCLTHANR